MGTHTLSNFGRELNFDDTVPGTIMLIAAAVVLVVGCYMLTVGRRHWRFDTKSIPA